MSPQKAFVALLERALRELVAPGAETRSSTTAERCTAELLSPDGVVATFTVRVRAAPSCDPGQLALPGMGGLPTPERHSRAVVADMAGGLPDAPAAGELVELVAVDGWEPTPADERVDATTVIVWTSNDADHWRTIVPAEFAPWVRARLAGQLLFEGPAHRCSHVVRVGDSVDTRLGSLEVLAFMSDEIGATTGLVLAANRCDRVVSWLDSAADPEMGAALVFGISPSTIIEQTAAGVWQVAGTHGQVPGRAPAPQKPYPAPSKKSAPGSKKKPHRLTPVPEADALAQQGALVAVALQPDGHWKRWASNPEKPGAPLLTSPEWKQRWHRARTNDLRVRLYNRARRCTHDSLDGDIEGAE